MLGKAKNFVVKKMLERQLKDAPKEQQEMFMQAFENNPELFEKIAKDMKVEMKGGKDQMAAAMKVMPKYQAELQKALGASPQAGNRAQFNPNGSIRR